MADSRTVRHVEHGAGAEQWLVTEKGNDSTRNGLRTKAEAVQVAKTRIDDWKRESKSVIDRFAKRQMSVTHLPNAQ